MITTINEFKKHLNENNDENLSLPQSREEFEKVLNHFIYTMISSFSNGDETSDTLKTLYEMIVGKSIPFTEDEDGDLLLDIPQMETLWNEIKEVLPTISEDVMNAVIVEYKYEFDDVIKNDDEFTNESVSNTSDLDNKLEKFLSKFPDNATSWSQATDEIIDVCSEIRLMYNDIVLDVLEGEPGYIDGLDFRSFNTPAEYNTNAKKMIRELWYKLSDEMKEIFYKEIEHYLSSFQ